MGTTYASVGAFALIVSPGLASAQSSNCPFGIGASSARANLSDALFLTRYAYGLNGNALLTGIGIPVANEIAIRSRLHSDFSRIDVDDDGRYSVYDGQIATRMLLGFRSDLAIAGLTPSSSGSRNTAAAVKTFLDSGCTPTNRLDADGVQMLVLGKETGSSLRLGAQDPNNSASFGFDYRAVATLGQDSALGGLRFWNVTSTQFTYSSTGATGYTARFHLYASGGQQQFNWKTQNGFLSSATDVNNQEFTVYVRVHELLTPTLAQIQMKIRGGAHTSRDPDAGSCTMMTFSPATNPGGIRFGKELIHPRYDYVKLTPISNDRLQENVWVGLKVVSFTPANNAAQVVNRLYIDTTPFDASGRPANNWRLLSEYVDEEGKSTGSNYTKLANWGGWQTTLRVDGYRSVDFAFPSVREVIPR